jgi:eukaryotic-like serine/threonine-protein kinase
MPVPATAIDFLKLVKRSELVDKYSLKPYFQFVEQSTASILTPKQCALILVREGLLTFFQANLLMKGKWRNFFIGGKYKVLEHLGTGGMGTVYLCEHRVMRRRVAVKLLPEKRTEDGPFIERFRREAQAAARLNHPNIVQVHDIDLDGKINFLVMEFIDGIGLQQLVDIRGPLPLERAVNYITQSAKGLQHAHEAGLVHRDMKPSNLILDRKGEVKILDFGLVRFDQEKDDGLTKQFGNFALLGTIDYLAPEQGIRTNVDIRADIYSLGCVLFFLLTAKQVFHGGGVTQKLIHHQYSVPPKLTELQPHLPESLNGILDRMLAKSPNDRFQSPIEVVEALAPWFKEVELPTRDEMPTTRYHHHRDIETLSKLSTVTTKPKTAIQPLPPDMTSARASK